MCRLEVCDGDGEKKHSDMNEKSLGNHMFVDLYGCDSTVINSPNTLMELVLRAVEKSGATILSTNLRQFDPQGVSGVILISESHMAFHSWPEHGVICLDYFTCGSSIDPHVAIEFIVEELKPNRIAFSNKQRGLAYDA